jgi:hypothetical protein
MRFHHLFLLAGTATARLQAPQHRQLEAPSPNEPYKVLSPLCAEPPASAAKPFATFIHESGLDPATQLIDIPCDESVIIPGDSKIKFGVGLSVSGKLSFEDNGQATRIESPTILVRGYLEIGSVAEPYSSPLHIVLTDGGDDLVIEDEALGEYNPLTFNEKGLVVLGGKVTMVGATDDVYTHLLENVPQGSKVVKVGKDVSWKAGDRIAIASGTYHGQFSSFGTIIASESLEGGGVSLTLDEGTQFGHIIRYFEKSMMEDRSEVYLRPEVVKINRNIVISGSASDDGEGGYFVMSHCAEKQVVEGVEFVNMGQTGEDNRFPIQIAFGGYVPEGTRITKNSIHHSLQRCVVIQATHDVIVDNNVAYHTHGHCFVTEDGIETGNKFLGNVAMHIVAPTAAIDAGDGNAQTDSFAAAFYMASPSNDIKGNVVAGAQHTGFFYESFLRVRGASAKYKLPGFDTINVKHLPFGVFEGNLAHGVQIGLNPGFGRSPSEPMTFFGFSCWSVYDCFHSQQSHNLSLDHVTAVDFLSNGVSALNAQGFTLKNALLVGELNPPKDCGVRDVAGIIISSSLPFTIQNIHFQKLSQRTNCQKTNYGIDVQPTPTAGGIIHPTFINLSFDESVDTHYNIAASPMAISIQGMGAGDLAPGGTLLTSDKLLTSATCNTDNVKANGSGLVYCPNSCWKSIVVEWTGAGDIAVYKNVNTNEEFSQLATVMNVNGSEKKTVVMTLPVGRYDFKQYDNQGGLVVSSIVKRYDIEQNNCGGAIYSNE